MKSFSQDNHLLKIWCSYSPNSVLHHCICHWLRHSKNSSPKNCLFTPMSLQTCMILFVLWNSDFLGVLDPFYFHGMDKNCSSKYLSLYSTESKSYTVGLEWHENDLRYPFNPYEFSLPFLASPFHDPLSPYITNYILYWGKNIYCLTVDELVFPRLKELLFCSVQLYSVPGEHLSPIRSVKVVRTKLASGWLRCRFWATQTSPSWVTETAKGLCLSPLAFSIQSA